MSPEFSVWWLISLTRNIKNLEYLCNFLPIIFDSCTSFSSVMYCSDPGHVEHSTRSLSDPKLLVGTTIQYSCNPGFILQGGATITCYGREPGTPVWTSRLPHCVCKYQDTDFPEQKHNIKHDSLVVFTHQEKLAVIFSKWVGWEDPVVYR